MFLRGQMNLKSFLDIQILKVNTQFGVLTYDQIQFLGISSEREEVGLLDFQNVSLKLKAKSDYSLEGFDLFKKYMYI